MRQIRERISASMIKGLPEERISELDEFISGIERIPYFKPDGEPRKEWRMFYGKTLAEAWSAAKDAAWVSAMAVEGNRAMEAAKDAAWVSAMGAIRDAAIGANRDASWIAAWDAARDATWNAVGPIARTIASVAAGDAVLDAALMAQLIVVKDLGFEGKDRHIKHVSERMDVWRKGYGVAADVNGILYVYCVGRR
jgi:hypothetical protein